ncbi:hypothetical protein PSEUDO8AS_100049 [Pseudomonas sp. 8AS]|nr:hypothetical protein PSEUDO8AS_100049 [Pseudomonas sp. 8AS]
MIVEIGGRFKCRPGERKAPAGEAGVG